MRERTQDDVQRDRKVLLDDLLCSEHTLFSRAGIWWRRTRGPILYIPYVAAGISKGGGLGVVGYKDVCSGMATLRRIA